MIEKQLDHNEIISICAGAGYIASHIANTYQIKYVKLFSSITALFVLWLIYDPILPTINEWVLAGLTGFFSVLIIDLFNRPSNLILDKLDTILRELKK